MSRVIDERRVSVSWNATEPPVRVTFKLKLRVNGTFALTASGTTMATWREHPGDAEIDWWVNTHGARIAWHQALLEEKYGLFKEYERVAQPDPRTPDTLGWRMWHLTDDGELQSPTMDTVWHEPELRVEKWSDSTAVRGEAGIHAHLMPSSWHRAIAIRRRVNQIDKALGFHEDDPDIWGIVERFGRFVLGTEGWRAEWVVIRELMAPSNEVGLTLERVYPEVRVHYPE